MNVRFSRAAGRWGLLALGLVLVPGLVGCGGPFTGVVTGSVKYNGKPLPGGIVTVIHPDGRIGQGKIQPDGTYTVPDAPGGDVKVTVQTVPPIPAIPVGIRLPGGLGGEKAETVYPAGPYVPIPPKYAKPETSGLSLTVKRGSQPFDIEL